MGKLLYECSHLNQRPPSKPRQLDYKFVIGNVTEDA